MVHFLCASARSETRRKLIVLLQNLRHRFGLMKSGMEHRCPSLTVFGVHIRATLNQEFRDRCLIRMRGRVQRRRAPMIILIVRINVRARINQPSDDFLVTFPDRAVQSRGAVLVSSIHQRIIGRKQVSHTRRVARLCGFNDFFRRIGHCCATNSPFSRWAKDCVSGPSQVKAATHSLQEKET